MKDFIKRHLPWLAIGTAAVLAVSPAANEYKTFLLIVAVECLALGLSTMAVFAYTKIDFIREKSEQALGTIFLGVHILTGLTVLGVYIAQFSY